MYYILVILLHFISFNFPQCYSLKHSGASQPSVKGNAGPQKLTMFWCDLCFIIHDACDYSNILCLHFEFVCISLLSVLYNCQVIYSLIMYKYYDEVHFHIAMCICIFLKAIYYYYFCSYYYYYWSSRLGWSIFNWNWEVQNFIYLSGLLWFILVGFTLLVRINYVQIIFRNLKIIFLFLVYLRLPNR